MKGIIHLGQLDGQWRARLDIMEPICRSSRQARPRTLCMSEGATRAECLRAMAESLEILDNRLAEKQRP